MSTQTEKDNQKIISKNHENPTDVTGLLCSKKGWEAAGSVGEETRVKGFDPTGLYE